METYSTYVRTALEPVNETGLGVLDPVAVAWKWPICGSLFHDQLHVLHTTVEVRMEVSREGRVCNLVLLVRLIFDVGNVDGMPEHALWGEELSDKVIPVRQIVLALGSLYFPLVKHFTQVSIS